MNRMLISIASIALASAASAVFAAEPAPGATQRTLTIRVDDPRPISAAAYELETRHGLPITYEDAPYTNINDLANVGPQVRKGFENAAAEQVPPLWIPKGGTLDFAYVADRATGRPVSNADAMQAMLDSHAARGNAGGFRVTQAGEFLHIIPVSAKNAQGVEAPVTPALDSSITLARVQGNGIAALEALCNAVTKATGEVVVPGTFPVNLFGKVSVDLAADNANARDTLKALLAQLPGAFSWQLLWDPGMKFYALNIHSIE